MVILNSRVSFKPLKTVALLMLYELQRLGKLKIGEEICLNTLTVVCLHALNQYELLTLSRMLTYSPEETINPKKSKHLSLCEIDLKYPGQHLLLLKQSRRAHNVLLDFQVEVLIIDDLVLEREGVLHGNVETDRQRYARIPPELLVVIDARIESTFGSFEPASNHHEVVKSFYLLPSLMHRLESLMLASQLRQDIEGQSTDLHISNCLILVPGELTDLRSTSVNNENFASATVRGDLYPHLQYRLDHLQTQIADYVKSVTTSSTDTKKGLKVRWENGLRIIELLLSPIVTPDKLELPPVRDLMDMCDLLGYLVKDTCRTKGDMKRGITKPDQVQDNKDAEMDNEKDSNEDTKTIVLSSQPLADRKYIHDYF
ncbi:Argonaute/Dicer protein, PAZ [Artemisia annua]|uniref:Argonaute/Dicer protein, PAZ n=1 Tax=Artemisia annua TaxID=35608 RepID=A0A2U1MZV4_ARTAN|nr:Argonaute/Dicer protein, PAZ [Artemisia annua]